MTIDLVKLVKLLNLSTSDNEHESLLAITKANDLIEKADVTWDEIILKQKPDPSDVKDFDRDKWKKDQSQAKRFFDEEPEAKKVFEWTIGKLLNVEKLYARDFVLSVKVQFERKGYITFAQINSIQKIYDSVFGEETK